jgi:hypothetical protein
LNAERGAQFFSDHPRNEKKTEWNAASEYGLPLFLEENDIWHVVRRVNYLQTDGRCERPLLEHDRCRGVLASLDEFIGRCSNRMHGASLWDIAKMAAMPAQRNLQPETSLGRFLERMGFQEFGTK